MQVVMAAPAGTQQPMYVVQSSARPLVHYKKRSTLALGVVQVILGVALIGFQVGALAVRSILAPVSGGIWAGILVIVTGSFGIGAGATKIPNKCLIISNMVLSILSAVFVGFGVVLTSAISLPNDSSNNPYHRQYEYQYNRDGSYSRYGTQYYSPYLEMMKEKRVAMSACLIVLGVTSCVLSIISSAFSCRSVCCRSNTGQQQQQQYVQQPQMMMTTVGGAYPQMAPLNQLPNTVLVQPGQPMPAGPLLTGGTPVSPTPNNMAGQQNVGAAGGENNQAFAGEAPPVYKK